MLGRDTELVDAVTRAMLFVPACFAWSGVANAGQPGLCWQSEVACEWCGYCDSSAGWSCSEAVSQSPSVHAIAWQKHMPGGMSSGNAAIKDRSTRNIGYPVQKPFHLLRLK